jgi:hypothetical protein
MLVLLGRIRGCRALDRQSLSFGRPLCLDRSKEHDITPAHRIRRFVLDIIAFVEEKIGEALEDETWRMAAFGEAAGVVPLLRARTSSCRRTSFWFSATSSRSAGLGNGGQDGPAAI